MYISDGRESYFDGLAAQGGRYREATPEEDVRQTFVSFLRRDVCVPDDMLKTEDAVAHYVRLGRGRVDIVGLAKQDVPLFVVECKRLGLPLDDDFVNLEGDEARIHHNGRMRGGVIGASKAAMIDYLRREAPHLLDREGNVDLGALPMNRRLEWPDARRLILRCAEYALARGSFLRTLTESTENVN